VTACLGETTLETGQSPIALIQEKIPAHQFYGDVIAAAGKKYFERALKTSPKKSAKGFAE
jgi:hypothetical protein